MTAFRVDQERGTLEPREDFVEPEARVGLSLTSDATNISPIDNVPEIPADGQSTTTITVQKKAMATGRLLTGGRHNNSLNIRTTAGALSARRVSLKKGQATFDLRSSTETVVAQVRVWGEDIPQPATICIEFAPTQ